jgi:MFS family permease
VNVPLAPTPNSRHWTAELRVGLFFAGFMLMIPLAGKLAARYGWVDTADFTQRALMASIAAYLVVTGNTIPKRLASLACMNVEPAPMQAFYRLAGWVWVLTGLAFGVAWILLPSGAAGSATLIIVPAGITLVVYRWVRLRAARRPAP